MKLNQEKTCLGSVWRYKENSFINSKGEIVLQRRIRQLKSKSCNWVLCASCIADMELKDFVSDTGEMPTLPDNVKDGDELGLHFSVASYDNCDEGIENMWFEIIEKSK